MANIFQIQTYELKGCQFFNSEFCRTQEEGRHTRRKINASVIFSSFFLHSQPIVITISDRKLQFTTYWVLCSLCNFLQSCLYFPFHPVRARAGVCRELSTVLKPELWQTKLNTFHSVLLLLFPPLNSWSDCFYFVTKSSGMTCNTPNLAFNPQCNSKEIKLRAALRANLHTGWLLRFLSSGSKWAKSIRNAVSFGNEETQASLWREEPGLHTDWKAAYSQWDP